MVGANSTLVHQWWVQIVPWVHRWQLLVEPGGAAIMVGDSNQDGVRLLLNTPVPGRYMGVPTIALESP